MCLVAIFWIKQIQNTSFPFQIEVQLIDNVVLVSGVQQSDSEIYIYIYIGPYMGFPGGSVVKNLSANVGDQV